LCGFRLNLGRYDDALSACVEAVAQAPDPAEAQGQLGRAFMALGNLSSARESLGRCIQLSPAGILCLELLATLECDYGNCDEAESAARQAIALAPETFSSQGILASILSRRGEDDAASIALQRHIQMSPNPSTAGPDVYAMEDLWKGRFAEAHEQL